MITNIPNISVIYKNNPLFFTHVICNLRVSKATIWLKAYSLCPLILKTKLKKGLYVPFSWQIVKARELADFSQFLLRHSTYLIYSYSIGQII